MTGETDTGADIPAGGLTCKGTPDAIPYCAGVDCPEWADCHGDRLRGYSEITADWWLPQ